ncbi:MAG: YciI family protein [Rhodobacteraceae bacterium]|nr:YciI family protein [Paracoccaceae bacterium]
MQYMALIYSTPGSEATYDGDMMADYMQFAKDATEAGVMVAGDALNPVTDASSVRVRNGKTVVTDGPFAETKEVLGGYYLLECADLDQALHWAARIPTAKQGTVEVRPIMVFDM